MKDGLVWNKKHYNVDDFQDYDLTPAPFLVRNIDVLKQNNVKVVLDAGCGQGRNVLYLLQNGFEVIGVDGAPNALTITDRLLRANNEKNYKLINSELQDLKSLKKDSVDAVIAITVLTHIFDPELVIAEFKRILKKEGIIILDFATIRDSTYTYISKGQKMGHNMFLEEGTKVRYIENEKEILPLFSDFEILSIKEESFVEPGHPGSRPFEHEHSSYVIVAKKK